MRKYLTLLILLCILPSIACGTDYPKETETAVAKASATQWAGVLLTATVITWTPSPTVTPTYTPTQTFTPSLTFTPSQTFTPSITPTPSDTSEPSNTPTPRIRILENIDITSGGVEVFPLPDRSSGRLFAAMTNFSPHVVGRNEDGNWVYIVYFEGRDLQTGWVSKRGVAITDNQYQSLKIIDPENPPNLPRIEFDEEAVRPYGVAAPQTTRVPTLPAGNTQPTAAQPNSQATTVQQATQPPQPTVPASAGNSCGGATTCSQMASCQQAYACLQAGNGRLDNDNDGVPCESICPGG